LEGDRTLWEQLFDSLYEDKKQEHPDEEVYLISHAWRLFKSAVGGDSPLDHIKPGPSNIPVENLAILIDLSVNEQPLYVGGIN
jgi:hypothetical protein